MKSTINRFMFAFMLIMLKMMIWSCNCATHSHLLWVENPFSLSRDVVSQMMIAPSIVLFLGLILLVVCICSRRPQKVIAEYYQKLDLEHSQKQAGTFVPTRNSEGEIGSRISTHIIPLVVILMLGYSCSFCRVPHSNKERNATHLRAGIISFVLGIVCLIAFLIPMSIGFHTVNHVMYTTSQPNMGNITSFDLYFSNHIYACCLEVYNSYYALDQSTYVSTATYDLGRLIRPLYCAYPKTDNEHNGTNYGNFIDQVRGRFQAIEYAEMSCNAGAVIFIPDMLPTIVALGSCGFAFGFIFLIGGTICTFVGRNLSNYEHVSAIRSNTSPTTFSKSATCKLIGFPPNFTDSLAEGQEKKCCICFEYRACCALNPCGHSDFCYSCVSKLGMDFDDSRTLCPICRATFTSGCKVIL